MTDLEKIALLQSSTEQVQVCEVVAVSWSEGIKYYGKSAWSETHPFRGINIAGTPIVVEARLLTSTGFTPFELSPDLSDEQISLTFADVDLEIQRLFYNSGEGARVEIFYYYPQVDLSISRWFGQLSPPDQGSYEQFVAKAGSGFMSRLIPLPRGNFGEPCQLIFGAKLPTQAEIDRSGCPYNKHIGGSVGNLNSGVPFTSCAHNTTDCNIRLDDLLSYGGFVVKASAIVSDSKGNLAASRGNSSNLKRPPRTVIGAKYIRDVDLLAWRREPNPTTPDKGFVSAVWAVSRGPVDSIFDFSVNDGTINIQAINYRVGTFRQPPTSYAPDISNFSGISHIFARLGWVNANQIDATQLKTLLAIHGYNQIRIYTDADTYTQSWTNNRVWGLLECYANRIWGRGYDYSRFDLESWITAAGITADNITFTDPLGATITTTRTIFDADINGRLTQEVVTDICRAGRLSLPFQSAGKYTISNLVKWPDLSTCKVFTDIGASSNIVRNNSKPSISYSQISARELPNQINLTFEWSENLDIERPLTFFDEDAQLAAGIAFGDESLRPIEKSYSAFGVRRLDEATKLGWMLLHLGEFDSGGLKNNLKVTFTTSHINTLDLKKYDVIKIESNLISRFGFQYFRALKFNQQSDGNVQITAQAYPNEYYETLEVVNEPVDPGYQGVVPVEQPTPPTFGDIIYSGGFLQIPVDNF